MKASNFILLMLLMTMSACNREPSLQKYFVESTEDSDFVSVDVSPSILNINENNLTADQKSALATFDKMNVLAFKLDETNKSRYEVEKTKVVEILKDEKYQPLMKFGKGKDGVSVSYVGTEDDIKEFVIFASNEENGFAVARILGKDMNPTSIMTMIDAMKHSNVNLEQLKPFQDILMKK
jgi:hypothetical protein